MNETQTSAVAEIDADSFLAQGLAQTHGVDTSGYHTQPQADDNSTEKTSIQDRGTDEPAAETTNDPTGSDKSSASTSEAEAKAVEPVKGKARAPNRIAELLQQVKERDAKIAEYEKAKATQVTQPQPATEAKQPQEQQIPVMAPKPEYTADVLKAILKKKQYELDEHIVNADLPKIRETREFMENVGEKLRDAETWENRNKELFDKYNATTGQLKSEILKTNPDWDTPGSPIFKEREAVHNQFMELQKNPALYESKVASIARLRLNAANSAPKVAALEEQVKQLQQKLKTYEEKSRPLKQEEAPASGSNVDTDDPDADLLRNIRQILPKRR